MEIGDWVYFWLYFILFFNTNKKDKEKSPNKYGSMSTFKISRNSKKNTINSSEIINREIQNRENLKKFQTYPKITIIITISIIKKIFKYYKNCQTA